MKAGSYEPIWLWIVIESKHKEILSFNISKKHNMLSAERFLSYAVSKYGIHTVSSDGGTCILEPANS